MKKVRISLPNGFTLMEILIAVIVLATISSLAFPQYKKIAERQKCDGLKMNLRRIAAATAAKQIIKGTGAIPTCANPCSNIPLINAHLGTNVVDDPGFTYQFNGFSDGSCVNATRNPNSGYRYSCFIFNIGTSTFTISCAGPDAAEMCN